jgi:hypothetical protein
MDARREEWSVVGVAGFGAVGTSLGTSGIVWLLVIIVKGLLGVEGVAG